MLRDFVERSLPLFGRYEDAMWAEEPFVYHSRLSAPLNVKLLDPRACVEKAVEAYEKGEAPINSVEGFVRQIIGWREFIRGVYWLFMPDYAEKNHLRHQANVPDFFWDGETDMQCVRQSMKHVVRHGYAHHIHRLMVLGNLALLLGVHPRSFHEWHMGMYVDAVDWVSLPNALGMSQHADGGIVGTKPYVSTGNYIHRMSNFCRGCKYDYRRAAGDGACPFTTLYWDFLDRHYKQFKSNPRMGIQMKHVDKKRQQKEIGDIRSAAKRLKREWCRRKGNR
jgi:deoxyribodipyrimidine photolyase-related protein